MKKITMQQIADHLGVSKFVVSRALSGKGGVNETTRERVIQAASRLGYFNQKNGYVKNTLPAPTASIQLAQTGKQSVLVLMPNIRFQNKDSLYWGRLLEGISGELEAQELGMIIVSDPRSDHFINILNPAGILGMIGVGQIATPFLLEVHRLGLTMVLVDHEDPLIPCDTIFANNLDGMARLTNHLIGLGHRHLHFLGNSSFSRSFRDRWLGFRSALEENGLLPEAGDDPMLKLEGIENGAYREKLSDWVRDRKQAGSMPTALVCANDAVALIACSVLDELGIAVPDEVAVSGFDNIADTAQHIPPVTTVNVPKEELGQRAVKKLLERLNQPSAPQEKIMISVEAVYRNTTAGPFVGTQ
ncbi:LacI family DNA-binding transcriptional regulator [Paenibacillus senegalimassiliensis]|uniref:LacI family DNA-binding transcriptional regulator n=1 Tax=Paenibacillus senegalimassiliensis TaxID=1737426 RepID=UPI000A502A9A|nr:LacI family DNA-binding transcriptional regulator [Paenibacillus senegalimassiliensis]